ncbi:MAG: class I SAM-dependent methyltransferase [Solirubrobacteraceae bacterium]|nr:class I SAM-dependent methyltransferase [Solirubrobacteraceae bacterium]
MSTISALEALKDTHRKTWASGDYPSIAELVTDVGASVAREAGVRAGSEVLDVAAGTGNAAIPAALAGAQVIASDLTPELFVAGRRRAAEAGVAIEWITADAEDLPFEDARFDTVLSSLGVQFAPRHEVVADELVRVCRPGGTIVLGNWAADGYIGRFWSTMGPYLPAPPTFASPPPGWGRVEHVEALFADHPVELTFTREAVRFEDASAEAFLDMFADRYGPLLQARAKLSQDGRWNALRDDLIALGTEMNIATDGTFAVGSDYLVIVAHKAA